MLDCDLRRIVGFYCSFKGPVISRIVEDIYDRFCGKSAADGISPQTTLTWMTMWRP
jgi:hypothetical protein